MALIASNGDSTTSVAELAARIVERTRRTGHLRQYPSPEKLDTCLTAPRPGAVR